MPIILNVNIIYQGLPIASDPIQMMFIVQVHGIYYNQLQEHYTITVVLKSCSGHNIVIIYMIVANMHTQGYNIIILS